MKRTLIILSVAMATTTGILGVKGVRSHLSTVQEGIKTTVRGVTPAEYEVRRIKALIADMSKDVLAFGDKIAEIEQTAQAQREDIRGLAAQLAADRAALLTERNLLAQEGEVFTILGATYSRSQVEASAAARLAQIQRDQATQETKRQVVERLQVAAREGRGRLQEAVAVRDTKVQELEILVADLTNAELQRDLQALSSPLSGVLSRSQTELAASLKAFSNRVRDAKRQVEGGALSTAAPAIIAHETGAPQSSLLQRIDRALTPLLPASSGG